MKLQIYSQFVEDLQQLETRLHGQALRSVWGFDLAPNLTKNVAILFEYLPRICSKGLFDVREVKYEEFGAE